MEHMVVLRRKGSNWRVLARNLVIAICLAGFGLVVHVPESEAVPRKVKRACRGDYKSLCPRYRPGTSRMRSCMRAKGSQLSWSCYEALRDHGYVKRGARRSSRGRRGRRSYRSRRRR